ncbi:MAG: hypothetical protein H7070_10425 [Saprospiraceae bacterium]|nr:hypothetical protein [Pyrinomonadaceae bacterium]
MKIRVLTLCTAFLLFTSALYGQNAQSAHLQYSDPIGNIATDLGRISVLVEALNKRLKEFVDKFEKVGGMTLSEKQQKLVMGLEILVRAEQRLATLQKFQIDLVEKQGTSRSRLAQIERDAMPQSIDRSVAFEGTTKTEEIRESKRNALQAERQSLQTLLAQINSNLADANDSVREAQYLVQRLRRTFLPQIERELAEQ